MLRSGLGGLAQLARASALQAGGQGFESLALHTVPPRRRKPPGKRDDGSLTGWKERHRQKLSENSRKRERGYSGPASREGGGTGAVRDKYRKAHGGCLGSRRRRRTRQAAKSRGEARTALDPRMSEWGNPTGWRPVNPMRLPTRRTETSK